MKKELLLGLISELISDDKETNETQEIKQILGSNLIGKYVLLRGYDSGIHFGKLELASPGLYRLSESRRLWYWKNKQGIGLSSIATYGVHSDSKITCALSLIEITDNRISEIIPCTEDAIKSIKEIKECNP